ncbi:MAG: hypothetical protein LKG27_04735 [Clostridiaceae bacterium]|nr:hypothetical protein [Clostridiaceae bacterium]
MSIDGLGSYYDIMGNIAKNRKNVSTTTDTKVNGVFEKGGNTFHIQNGKVKSLVTFDHKMIMGEKEIAAYIQTHQIDLSTFAQKAASTTKEFTYADYLNQKIGQPVAQQAPTIFPQDSKISKSASQKPINLGTFVNGKHVEPEPITNLGTFVNGKHVEPEPITNLGTFVNGKHVEPEPITNLGTFVNGVQVEDGKGNKIPPHSIKPDPAPEQKSGLGGTNTANPTKPEAPTQKPVENSGTFPHRDGTVYEEMLKNQPAPEQKGGLGGTNTANPATPEAPTQKPVENSGTFPHRDGTVYEEMLNKNNGKTEIGGLKIENPAKPTEFSSIYPHRDGKVYDEMLQSVKDSKSEGGFFSKLGKFFKGKKGKFAIGAALLTAAGAGIYAACSGSKDEQAPTTPTVVPTPTVDTTPTTPTVDTTPTVPTEPTTPEVTPTEPTEPTEPENTDYIVKKGDNVWNIAKAHLTEKNGVKPTDKEIMEEVNVIMKDNQLEWEKDHYHVMIHPKDKLELAA